jgi:hypothetical protein
MVTHHMNKNSNGGQDSILGSTGIAASFDNLIYMDLENKKRIISTQPRFGDEIPKTYLEYNKDNGEFKLGTECLIDKLEMLKTTIMAVIDDSPEKSFTKNELSKSTKCNNQILTDAIKLLIEADKIIKTKEGNKLFYKKNKFENIC